MGKKPARKKGARRLNVTPELIANVRHRFEHSEERLATMAADLGCCTETVRAIARREGWVRYEPPPRDLSPAARLRVRAERLAEQQSPLIPAPGSAQGAARVQAPAGIQGDTEEPCQAAPGSPLSRGRADDVIAPDPAVIAAQMLHEVGGFLDDVRAARKRMKREGYAKHELQAVSRVIADCSASLARLKPMAQRAAEPDTGIPYDDMPADIDEFRNELARQIDALLDDAPDAGDRAAAADGAAAAAQA
jgi:hypothetical protein